MAASPAQLWPEGFDSAISLTFDGGLIEHWELVEPILEENGLKATFFLTMPAVLEAPEAWRRIAQHGHEIGNHSTYRTTHDGSLPSWTLQMVQDDIQLSQQGFRELLQAEPTAFALDGTNVHCADGDYTSALDCFSCIRTPHQGKNQGEIDVRGLKTMDWAQLQGPVESILPGPSEWSVAVFSGFYSPEFLAAEDDLRLMIAHLKQREDIWCAPLSAVANEIANQRATLR